jgi:ADP-ribose pyrophosphatase
VDAARARDRHALQLVGRQAGGLHLLARARPCPLHEAQAGGGANGPGELRGIVARNPVEHLGPGDELREPHVLFGSALEAVGARLVRRMARRSKEIRFELHVQPLVDLAQTIDELRLERRGDHYGDSCHGIVLSISGRSRRMDREVVFEGTFIDVVRKDGKEIVEHDDAVAIVAVSEGHVTLVRQERVATGGKLLELPAGILEEGESPLETARRELREETGLHDGEWVEVAAFFTSPGFTDEKIYLFIATGLEQGKASPEGTEDLELVRVPLEAVSSLIEEVEDGKTLAGLLLLLRR